MAPTLIVGADGLTLTDAIGIAETVTAVVALFPSLAAVMVIGPPTATPVTRPLDETAAMLASLDNHVTVRPDNVFPAASRVTAVSCTEPPTLMLGAGGLTVIEATGTAVTVIDAVAVFPSQVAVITAGPPTAMPVTIPVKDTLATPGSADVQVTVRPDSTFPLASNAAALSWSELPTTIVGVTPLMVTDATETDGGGGGDGGADAGGAAISLPLHDRTMTTPTILRNRAV